MATERIYKPGPGRPKGSMGKPAQGLPIAKRLKVLQKIILDPNEKSVDRLNAIKLMTEILADKVHEVGPEGQTTTIVFEDKVIKNIETKPLIPINKEESIIKNVETKEVIKEDIPAVEIKQPIQEPKIQQVTNNSGINMDIEFIIKDTNGDKLDE